MYDSLIDLNSEVLTYFQSSGCCIKDVKVISLAVCMDVSGTTLLFSAVHMPNTTADNTRSHLGPKFHCWAVGPNFVNDLLCSLHCHLILV